MASRSTRASGKAPKMITAGPARVVAGASGGGRKSLAQKAKEAKVNARMRRVHLIQEGMQNGCPRMSVKVLLKEIGLEKYYTLFEKSGYDVIESYQRRSDKEAEEMLNTIEQINKMKFPQEHRIKLWKMMMYRWFHAPSNVKRFVLERDIPRLFLPKRDHRQRDADIEITKLDPDRQRMIIRKQAIDEMEGKRIMQFEVYHRHPDDIYELRDIQRTVTEWQHADPSKMLRQDPREEVFLMRIRSLELRIAQAMMRQKAHDKRHFDLVRGLKVLRLVCGVLAFFMVFASLQRYREIPGPLVLKFTVSSRTFLSGIAFFMGCCFVHGVMGHWRQSPEIARLNKMNMQCKKMSSALTDFRLESEEQRLDKFDVPLDDMSRYFGLTKDGENIDWSEARKRVEGRKDFEMWMKAHNPTGRAPDYRQMRSQIDETYEDLPPLPDDFERQGGDRYERKRREIGGAKVHERTANMSMKQTTAGWSIHVQQHEEDSDEDSDSEDWSDEGSESGSYDSSPSDSPPPQIRGSPAPAIRVSPAQAPASAAPPRASAQSRQAEAASSSSMAPVQPPLPPPPAGLHAPPGDFGGGEDTAAPPRLGASGGLQSESEFNGRASSSGSLRQAASSSTAAPPRAPDILRQGAGAEASPPRPPTGGSGGAGDTAAPPRWADRAPNAPDLHHPAPPTTGASRPPSSESQRSAAQAASQAAATAAPAAPVEAQVPQGSPDRSELPGTPEQEPGMGDLPLPPQHGTPRTPTGASAPGTPTRPAGGPT